MIEIAPFRGLLYSPQKIKSCLAPPYDEIFHKLQETLYKKDKHNIVRIVRGKEYTPDNDKNNKYTRAKEYFQKWCKDNILKKEEKNCLYLLEQEYQLNNKKRKRQGIISLLKLQGVSSENILPHENTRPAPLEDQFQMLKTLKAHFSPIFFLYQDKKRDIHTTLESAPKKILFNFTLDSISHKLHRIDDENATKEIVKKMQNKKVIIADGHHRYWASLRYQQEYKHNFTFAYLTEIDDENLNVLSFHRYIQANNLLQDAMFKRLSEYFYLRETNFNLKDHQEINQMLDKLNNLNISENVFGMYLYKKFYFLKLKNKKVLKDIMPEKSSALRNLSTSILHKLVLENIFGEEIENISYLQDAVSIIKDINKNKEGVAFFVNNPSPSEVKSIVENKEIMPPKSTYFYPKIYSGLITYCWEENV